MPPSLYWVARLDWEGWKLKVKSKTSYSSDAQVPEVIRGACLKRETSNRAHFLDHLQLKFQRAVKVLFDKYRPLKQLCFWLHKTAYKSLIRILYQLPKLLVLPPFSRLWRWCKQCALHNVKLCFKSCSTLTYANHSQQLASWRSEQCSVF